MGKVSKKNIKQNNSKLNSSSNSSTQQQPQSNPLSQFIPQASLYQSENVGFFKNPFKYLHEHIMLLNSSKFFAGIVMIMLNVGSKFISIQFSKSTEEYLKYTLSKQILVFAMAWMGTRDIYTALTLTAVFVILSEHIFNEESSLCLVPHNYRVLHKVIDTNNDGIVSESEINNAISVLEKAKKEKQKSAQKDAFLKFKSYDDKITTSSNIINIPSI